MKALTRADFQEQKTNRATVVGKAEVPALGGVVSIAKLSAGGRDRITAAMINLGKADTHYHAQVAVEAACSENGEKLFTQADLKWLSALDEDALTPIVDEANRLYKIAKEDEGDKTKNSSAGQTDGSATD